ncbi:MAG: transketolase [Deltaproteobacteria bacterium]|nr:transketolase [Deltaproteobacteria bacterium]
MRKTCLDMVHKLAVQDPRIVFIGSDLGHGTLADFARQIPERFFMEGISEANVIGMASGLALCGKIVYVNTIASFLTRRCFEQIVLDLCLHKARVRLIGNGGGMVYAPLGPTHETVEDLAVMRALPNMTVVAPADADEMKRLMPQTVDYPGPIYIRLAKGYDPIVSADSPPFQIGRGMVVRSGTGALLITTGITLKIAMQAADLLERNNISCTILHLPTIKPLDHEAILRCAGQVGAIVTVEEHSIIGGLGGAVAEVIAEADFSSPKRFKRLGLPDIFPDDYGSQSGLLKRYGLTPEHVAATVRSLL